MCNNSMHPLTLPTIHSLPSHPPTLPTIYPPPPPHPHPSLLTPSIPHFPTIHPSPSHHSPLPHTSIWSNADHLYGDSPRHWSGPAVNLSGMLSINGELYRFVITLDTSCNHVLCIPTRCLETREGYKNIFVTGIVVSSMWVSLLLPIYLWLSW